MLFNNSPKIMVIDVNEKPYGHVKELTSDEWKRHHDIMDVIIRQVADIAYTKKENRDTAYAEFSKFVYEHSTKRIYADPARNVIPELSYDMGIDICEIINQYVNSGCVMLVFYEVCNDKPIDSTVSKAMCHAAYEKLNHFVTMNVYKFQMRHGEHAGYYHIITTADEGDRIYYRTLLEAIANITKPEETDDLYKAVRDVFAYGANLNYSADAPKWTEDVYEKLKREFIRTPFKRKHEIDLDTFMSELYTVTGIKPANEIIQLYDSVRGISEAFIKPKRVFKFVRNIYDDILPVNTHHFTYNFRGCGFEILEHYTQLVKIAIGEVCTSMHPSDAHAIRFTV